MTSCIVCGEQEFESKDGLFFCTTCMTQSQDLREEEKEDDAFDSNIGHQIKTKKTSKRKTASKDEGRPWHSYEAFQLIIKEQVKALIDMGADPKLKEVVFRLWCAYLSKCGVAFPVDSEKQPAFFKTTIRHRESCPPTLADPTVKARKLIKTLKMKTGGSKVKSEEKMRFMTAMQGEEFYDSDDPFDDSDSEGLDDFYISGDGDYFEEHKQRQFQDRYARNRVEWMKMLKTLSFCYIGLMYTNPLTTVVDIIRWSREEKIPYITASKLLPADMKFSCYDNKVFIDRFLVEVDKLQDETRKLMAFLELDDIPVNCTGELINKYLIQLKLPGELHGLVQSLREVCLKSKQYQLEKARKRTIVPFDMVAMAYIVTILEMLLGLDDHTEKELSRLTEELLSLCPGHKLFIWDRWVKQEDLIRSKSAADIYTTTFDTDAIVDVDAFMKSCSTRLRSERRYSIVKNAKRRKFQPNIRKNLCQPLKLLADKLHNQQQTSCDNDTLYISTNQNQDNSFTEEQDYNPDLQQTLVDDPVYNMEDASTSAQRLETENSALYRDESLAYIFQPNAFLKNVKNRDVKRKYDSNCASDESGMNDDLRNTTCFSEDTTEKYEMDDIESVLHDINALHVNRKLSVKWGCKDVDYSSSYRWLLDTCCGYVFGNNEELNNTINKLQMFLVKYAIHEKDSNDLIKFIQRYIDSNS